MHAKVYENCLVIVPRKREDYVRVGLYSNDQRVIEDSLFFRAAAPAPPSNGRATKDDFASITRQLDDEFIFGGIVFTHFGHLLTETFSRLAVFFESDLPILFISAPGGNNNLFWQFIEVMNLPGSRIVMASENLIIRKLHVSPPGFTIRRAIDHTNVRYFERLSSALGGGINTNETPIYLSRTRTRKNWRFVFGELVLEKVLKNKGVDIVHPQELPLNEQILLLKSRKNVCGFSGSAFHLLLFCQERKNVVYFDTRPINENYKLMESSKNNNVKYILLPKNTGAIKTLSRIDFLRRTAQRGPFLLGQKAIVEACRGIGINIRSTDIDAEMLRDESEAFVNWMTRLATEELYNKLNSGEVSMSKAETDLQILSEGLKLSVLPSHREEKFATLA